jgi:leucyl/phenylalanyl-tRNA--protein transferase
LGGRPLTEGWLALLARWAELRALRNLERRTNHELGTNSALQTPHSELEMIPLLGRTDPFPPVHRAMDEPNGLLAAGGGLSAARLLDAYSRGIFPWFSEGDPVLWWCPDPRMVLPTSEVHVSRSLRRRLRRADYEVTFDRAFADVLRECAAPRPNEGGTWLVPSMRRAYQSLHHQGTAHSVEVWREGALAGGLYGVALGRMFYGESMFSRQSDGSKIALVVLAGHLSKWGFPIVDCQMQTTHLATMGARVIPRDAFLRMVSELVVKPAVSYPWVLDEEVMAQLR